MNIATIKYSLLLICVYGLGIISVYLMHYTHGLTTVYLTKFDIASTSILSFRNNTFQSRPNSHSLTVKEKIYATLKKHIDIKKVSRSSKALQEAGFTPDRTVIIYDKLTRSEETQIVFHRKFPKTYKPKKTIGVHDSCAILGSSGILLGSRCGKEIDAHDYVMRSNMARTIGFEEDVGIKTNLTTMNYAQAKMLSQCLSKNIKRNCSQIALDLMEEFNGALIWFSKFGVVNKKPYVAFTESVIDQGLKTDVSYPGFGMPRRVGRFWNISTSVSSGLLLYTIAGAVCSKVSMYGFFPFYETTNGNPVPHHYYENVTFNYTKRHNMPDEFKLFLKLNQTGQVRLVAEQCRQNN